jgi:hypothetical protein
MHYITFKIPKGMTQEQVALTFGAYLTTHLSACEGHKRQGPTRMREGSNEDWQLDAADSFWLHVYLTREAMIRCRHDSQLVVMDLAVKLFAACNPLSND